MELQLETSLLLDKKVGDLFGIDLYRGPLAEGPCLSLDVALRPTCCFVRPWLVPRAASYAAHWLRIHSLSSDVALRLTFCIQSQPLSLIGIHKSFRWNILRSLTYDRGRAKEGSLCLECKELTYGYKSRRFVMDMTVA